MAAVIGFAQRASDERPGRGRLFVGLTVAAVALGACDALDSTDGASRPTTVRDSAGIRIVENAPEMSIDSCTIPNEPAVSIGAREGPPEHQLYRVMGATLLSDGRIAVLNSGSSEIRVFDPEGDFLHAFGREGEGPGEFESPLGLWNAGGDTLVVADQSPWRFLFFTPDGELLRSIEPRPGFSRTPSVMGSTADGMLVLGWECCFDGETAFVEQQLHLERRDGSGRIADTIGVYPAGRMGFLAEELSYVGRPIFEARSRAAVADDRIAVGLGSRREVRVLDPDGSLRTIVRWSGPSLDVTGEEVEAYRAEVRARFADGPASARRFGEARVSEDRPVAERFPAHDGVLIDRAGRLWVSRFQRPTWSGDGGLGWLVFGRDGWLLCHARTPPAIENVWDVREIGSDGLLATVRDSLGVEYLHVYRLDRPETSDR